MKTIKKKTNNMLFLKYLKQYIFFISLTNASNVHNIWNILKHSNKNSSYYAETNATTNSSINRNISSNIVESGLKSLKHTITLSLLTFIQLCAVNPDKCKNIINNLLYEFSFNSTSIHIDQSVLNFAEFYKDSSKIGIDWNNVIGMNSTIFEIKQMLNIISSHEYSIAARRIGVTSPKNMLLVGQPGTGKTLLAKATANAINAPLFVVSGSEIVKGKYAGIGIERVKSLFKSARKVAKKTNKVMIFIDEIDSCGRSRSTDSSAVTRDSDNTLNQLLVELDGFNNKDENKPNIIIFGATNRYDILDKALVRKGRFDNIVFIKSPNFENRKSLFEHFINKHINSVSSKEILIKNKNGKKYIFQSFPKNKLNITKLKVLEPRNFYGNQFEAKINETNIILYENDLYKLKLQKNSNIFEYETIYNGSYINNQVNTNNLATMSHGLNGANIESIVNEAILFALSEKRKYATNSDFENSLENHILGKPIDIDSENKIEPDWRIAVHEAGHILASFLLDNVNNCLKASILPRSKGSLGITILESKNINNFRYLELKDQLIMILSGKAAEHIFFDGDVTTGSYDDIDKAKNLANHIVIKYGMHGIKNVVNGKNNKIIAKIIYEAEKDALNLINENKIILQCIANELFDKITLNGDYLYNTCVNKVKKNKNFLEILKKTFLVEQNKQTKHISTEQRRINAIFFIFIIVFAANTQ